MRFNEGIAGVKNDLAIKSFGDEYAAMDATADQSAAILRESRGAADVKGEQTSGVTMLDIHVNRDAMARVGVTAGDVQHVIAAASGGRDAGMIFEGDRKSVV